MPNPRTETAYRLLAGHIDAYHRCVERNAADATAGSLAANEWVNRHADAIKAFAKDVLPSGAGVDNGTTVDLDASTGEKIVLHTSYRHMDDGGGYAGWTEHTITVRASLIHTVQFTISGRDRNGIKDYLSDLFSTALTAPIEQTWDAQRERYTHRIVWSVTV